MKIIELINDKEFMTEYTERGFVPTLYFTAGKENQNLLYHQGAIVFLGTHGVLYNQERNNTLYYFLYEEIQSIEVSIGDKYELPKEISYDISKTSSALVSFDIEAHIVNLTHERREANEIIPVFSVHKGVEPSHRDTAAQTFIRNINIINEVCEEFNAENHPGTDSDLPKHPLFSEEEVAMIVDTRSYQSGGITTRELHAIVEDDLDLLGSVVRYKAIIPLLEAFKVK